MRCAKKLFILALVTGALLVSGCVGCNNCNPCKCDDCKCKPKLCAETPVPKMEDNYVPWWK